MVDDDVDLVASEKGQSGRRERTPRCPIGGHRWRGLRALSWTAKFLQILHDILLDPPQIFHHSRELEVLSAQLFHERIYSVSPHLLFQVLDLGAAFAVPLGHLTERFLQLFLEHRHTRLDALLLFRGEVLEVLGVDRLTAAYRREGQPHWR